MKLVTVIESSKEDQMKQTAMLGTATLPDQAL